MTARNMGAGSVTQVKSINGLGPRHYSGLNPVIFDRVIYKMRGYFAAGQSYEYWQSPNPSQMPPSGHVLQNIAIAAIIDDSES